MDIDWIKNFSNRDNFHRFSISRSEKIYDGTFQHHLMAEYDNGYEWWVVAFIRDDDISGINDLPEWEAKDKKL